MSAGFRILPRLHAVDAETVAAFARLLVANVSNCMSAWRRGVRGCGRCTRAAG